MSSSLAVVWFLWGVSLASKRNYLKLSVFDLLNENKSFMNPIHGGGASSNGVASNIFTKYNRFDWVNTLNFNQSFGPRNNFGLLVGYERIKTSIDSWGAQRSNISDPYYTNYQGGFVNISPIGNVYSENALLSYFSNLTYDFSKKYFVSLNFRRDGLSALADGNKFGNFVGEIIFTSLKR